MTKKQLSEALKIARSDTDLSCHTWRTFSGCALQGFEPVVITIEMLAAFLRWHVINFDGSVDADELNDVASYGKRAFIVI